MEDFAIVAESRSGLGKGESRRLRRTGKLPAVLYGAGEAPTPITLNANMIGRQLANEAFFSHVLTVKVDGHETQAVVKALQREPSTSMPIHLDFQRVSSESELRMQVPLHFLNEEECPGRRAGGVINHLATEVEIGCLPRDLPEYIEVDMSTLEIGDAVQLSELVLPPGVRLMILAQEGDHDQPIVTVATPQKLEDDEEEGEGVEGEGEDEGEGEGEGEEAGEAGEE